VTEVKLLPPGVVAVAIVLVVAGLFVAMLGSPVLSVREGYSYSVLSVELYSTSDRFISPWMLFTKGLLGLAFLWHAVYLLYCDSRARARVVILLVICGVIGPLVSSFEVARIDSVFIYVGRFLVWLVSTVLVLYLAWPSTVALFARGGVSARRMYRYCSVCGHRDFSTELNCDECHVALMDRYETDAGIVVAREVGATDETSEGSIERQRTLVNAWLFGLTGLLLQITGIHPVWGQGRPFVIILGCASFVCGLWLYVKIKGREPSWALLGLAGIPGWVVLLLLEDRSLADTVADEESKV